MMPHTYRILLVEDDPVFARKLLLELEEYNITAVHAKNAEQTFELLRKADERCNIVLMDVVLEQPPDGIELAAQIKAAFDIPVIFLSSHTEPHLLARMEQVTSYGFIHKNNPTEALVANLKLALKLHTANTRLNEQEQLFRTVFEEGPLGLVIHDTGLNFTKINRRFCEITGYSEDELLDMNIMDLTLPEYRQNERKLGEPVLSGERKSLTMDKKYLTKNGRTIDVRIHGTVVHDKTGKPLYGFGLVEDISHQKKLQKKLRQSAHEKELLLRELQHRVKNNLMVISSILQMDSDRAEESAARAIIDHARNRVDAILEVYRDMNNSSNLLSINLQEYLERFARQLIKLNCPPELHLQTNFALEPLEAGPRKAIPLGLIVNELVTNSIKYAFDQQPEPLITITLQQQERRGVLEIADNGSGIPEGNDKNNEKKLGLNLIDLLSKQLGGEAEWDNNSGTRFRISWPL